MGKFQNQVLNEGWDKSITSYGNQNFQLVGQQQYLCKGLENYDRRLEF